VFCLKTKRPGKRRGGHGQVQAKKKGIARDIVAEAESGYDTVVMGRRGLSGIKEFVMGSVSQKVLHSIKDASIVIVS
jgi:nucleotide-binding universal stress UspA family protein